MAGQDSEKSNPAADPRKIEQDLRTMEQSLFADVQGKAEREESIGLLPKKEPHEKQIVLKFNPGKVKQAAKKGALWVALVVLLVSFFYNPFYCFFPWNYPLCYGEGSDTGVTGAVVADTEQLADETPAEQVPEPEPPPAAVEETAEANATEEAVDNSTTTASSSPSGTLTLSITDVELIKTIYGWKVGKISFTIDNNKEAFVGKIRARGFNSPNRMDMRSDKDLIIGALELESKVDSSILLNAQFDKPGDKLVVVELYDEGGAPGAAKDRRMASAEQKVAAK